MNAVLMFILSAKAFVIAVLNAQMKLLVWSWNQT